VAAMPACARNKETRTANAKTMLDFFLALNFLTHSPDTTVFNARAMPIRAVLG
jgi:hypothetical protein